MENAARNKAFNLSGFPRGSQIDAAADDLETDRLEARVLIILRRHELKNSGGDNMHYGGIQMRLSVMDRIRPASAARKITKPYLRGLKHLRQSYSPFRDRTYFELTEDGRKLADKLIRNAEKTVV